MNCEVLAVGTELLLGPSVDTNSAWIGERLAENGIDSFFHTTIGDNHARIVQAMKLALSRSDAVIVTGGLGATQDDITREAIAEVMGVELVFDDELAQRIKAMFAARQRPMPENNLRQAWRPEGSTVIPQARGTAPGLMCRVGERVVFLLPGVPFEMEDMMQRAVLPELRARSDNSSVIVSRRVRTWGTSESGLAELLAERVNEIDTAGGGITLAFLAHGIEGIHVRITAKAHNIEAATALLDAEEVVLRDILGSLVFGIDDETMEFAVGELLFEKSFTLGLAESVTGGLIASRLTDTPGASRWLRGAVVSYASEVKFSLLDVPEGPVVTSDAAMAMADGARRQLGSDIAISVTGVAGPDMQDDQPVGTVFVGLATPWAPTRSIELHLPGDRRRIREYTCINALDNLRRELLEHP